MPDLQVLDHWTETEKVGQDLNRIFHHRGVDGEIPECGHACSLQEWQDVLRVIRPLIVALYNEPLKRRESGRVSQCKGFFVVLLCHSAAILQDDCFKLGAAFQSDPTHRADVEEG